jgi:hypothetical protein
LQEEKSNNHETILIRNSEISSLSSLLALVTKRLRRIEEHAKTCDCCRKEVLEEEEEQR